MNITFKIEETDRFSIKAELLRSTQYIEIVCPNDKQIIELFRSMKEESRCKSTNWMWFEDISAKHGSVVHEFDVFRMDIVTSLRWNDFVVNLIGEEFQIDPLGESEKIVFTLKRRIEFVLDTYREFVLRKPIITTFTPCVAPYSSVVLKPWTEAVPKDLMEPNIAPDRRFDHPGYIYIEDGPEEVIRMTEDGIHSDEGFKSKLKEIHLNDEALKFVNDLITTCPPTITLVDDGGHIKQNPVPVSLIIDEAKPKLEHAEQIESVSDLSDDDKQYMPGLMNDLNALRQICITNTEVIDATDKLALAPDSPLAEQWLSEQNCVTLDSIPEDLIVNAEEMEESASDATSKLEENSSPEQNYIKFVLKHDYTPSMNVEMDNSSLNEVQVSTLELDHIFFSERIVELDFSKNSWVQKILTVMYDGKKNVGACYSIYRINNTNNQFSIELRTTHTDKFIISVVWHGGLNNAYIVVNPDSECLSELIRFLISNKDS